MELKRIVSLLSTGLSFSALQMLASWTAQDGFTGGNQPMAGYYDLVTAGLQQLDVPMQNPCIDVTSQLDDAEIDGPPGFLPTLPLKSHPKLCKDSFTPEQDNLLMTLKQAGKKYSEIVDAMRSQLGAEISVNRLVKRFDKIRDLYLDALPEAVKNVMPEVMACIKEEMAKMDLEALPHMDKQLLDEIVTELPRSIPKFVQSRVLRKRKTMMSAKVTAMRMADPKDIAYVEV
ncbi:hypothetical protein GQ53DRAFT_802602 [Thozetella sp. PMI_491]|nr:hypothetical protein GQ53DRAFT_802602 [Thozetella sp. PMI_491]